MTPITRLIIILLTITSILKSRIVLGQAAKLPPYFVKQPPKEEILFYVENEDLSARRSFEIPCEAKGDPEPDYFYTKNGIPFNWTDEGNRITQEQGKGTLRISPTKTSDVGQYQCFAENIWGIATSNSIFARKVELNSFRNNAPVKLEALEGQPFNLTCQSPGGYPTPTMNWLTQDNTGKLQGIEDPRITVDPEGILWFSNVTQDDAIEDSVYACAVTSPYISEVKTGAKIILKVIPMEQSSDGNEIAPIKQYTSKTEEIAISNKKAHLYCIFGGTPLPTITWYKNDKLIQFRGGTLSKDSGKSIEIKKVAPSDEGNYTCQASNGVGEPISHTITLKVLVEPRFTKKPESVTIDEQETVEFHCQATGNPTPEIIWIHNGNRLSEATINPRRAVSSNSIIIEKLWENDTGNYGCNATNSVGYVYQDAFVNVLAEPPNITQLPQNQEIIEGGTVTMSCRAVGSPKPQITWMRNNVELSDDRLATTKNGDLTITNATLADTGEYVCLAQNKISSINISANLSVRQHTRIPPELAPINTEIPAGEPVTLKCSAVIDPALELTISWLQNGEHIEFSDQHFVQNNDSSLIISKTRELDSGVYTCIAHTRLDDATAEALLVVQNIPNPPAIVSLLCNAKVAVISWKNTGENQAPIMNYILQYKISVSNTWEVLPNIISATETSFTVTMIPWTNYTFRVIAVNKIGNSSPSPPSSICNSSPPEVPHQNPHNLTIRVANNSNDLQISWEPMPKTYHNGPGFHYKVSWKKNIPEAEWENQTISNWEIGEYTIPNASPFTKYLVKVTAGNDLGQSELVSKILEFNTPADIPFKNPDDITIRASNSTTLNISWQLISKKDQNGPGFYYNVLWKKDTASEWQSQTITQPEKGEYMVHNVKPYEKYLVNVVAGNDRGPALQPSEPFVYQTLPDVPYKNPENVTVLATDPETLQISWTLMPEIDHNGPGFYYNVSWKINAPDQEWESQNILEWKTGEYTINVLPYEKYFVTVVAGNDEGPCTQPPHTVEGYYEEEVPLEAPANLTLIEVLSSTRANISWNRVSKVALRGNFRGYKIETWPEYDQQKGNVTEVIVKQNFDSVVIDKLTPNTKNKIRILVFNGKHAGPFSEELEIDTPGGVPNAVRYVEAKPIGSTALTLVWKPPSITNGPLTGYKIHYQTVSRAELRPMIEHTLQISDSNDTRVKLTDLEPDTNYRIFIQATTNAGDGEKSVIEQKTRPMSSLPMIKPDFKLEPIESKNSAAVKVIWLPCSADTDANCNNQPIGSEFRVDYALKEEIKFQRVIEKNDYNVIIRNLQPNKEYKFIVSSVDGTLIAKSSVKYFKTPEISTVPKTQSAMEKTELGMTINQSEESTVQSPTEKSSPESSEPKMKPMKNSGNFTMMWLIILSSIAFLIIVIILIAIYLKKLNEGDKYIVREQEIKNRRPDWPEDPDFSEVTQPLHEEVLADPGSPSKPDKDGMVMIPLN